MMGNLDFFHEEFDNDYFSNSSYDDYNEYDDGSFERNREFEFDFHFEKYTKNINDKILFQDLENKKNNIIYNSWYDVYFEESLSFNFSFYELPHSILFTFYKNNLEIKLFQKRKKLENFDKIIDSFIYIYITPLDDIYNQNYTNFVLMGSKEEKSSYYNKLIHRMKINISAISLHREKKIVNLEILKQIRNDLLKEAIVIKLPKKQNINNNSVFPKKNNLINNIREHSNIFQFSSYSYYKPSEYLFYPFIHFDEYNENKTKKELNKDKDEKIDKKENENNINQAEGINNISIGVQTENQDIKVENTNKINNNDNIKPEENEETKNK